MLVPLKPNLIGTPCALISFAPAERNVYRKACVIIITSDNCLSKVNAGFAFPPAEQCWALGDWRKIMNHDNICATIKELDEKVESIRAEMHKNAELAVHRGGGLEKVDPERLSRGREASAQNRKLKPKLVKALDALGRAYQQKGDEDRARFYFDQAKRSK